MNGIDVWSRRIDRGIGGVLAVLLAGLALLAAGDTAAWTLAISDARVDEIEGVLMIWFGCLGAVYGVRRRLHLGVEVLTRRLPSPVRAVLTRLSAVLVGLFGALLALHAWRLAATVSNTLPATGWPASVQYFPAAVAGVLIVAFALEQAFRGESPDVGREPST